MVIFPRRRSLWLKASILGTAVWLTLCFLLYTEDRTPINTQVLMASEVASLQMTKEIIDSILPFKDQTSNNRQVDHVADNHLSGPEQGKFFFFPTEDFCKNNH